MGKKGVDGDGLASLDIEAFPMEDEIIQEIMEEITELKIRAEAEALELEEEEPEEEEEEESSDNLGAKMGLVFDKVGGLDDQLNDIVRRVLASR